MGLDMRSYWSVSGKSYLAHVTKRRIVEAVTEGASAQGAERMAGFKKPDMVEAAEQALAGPGWLPPLLRTAASLKVDLPASIGAEWIDVDYWASTPESSQGRP